MPYRSSANASVLLPTAQCAFKIPPAEQPGAQRAGNRAAALRKRERHLNWPTQESAHSGQRQPGPDATCALLQQTADIDYCKKYPQLIERWGTRSEIIALLSNVPAHII